MRPIVVMGALLGVLAVGAIGEAGTAQEAKSRETISLGSIQLYLGMAQGAVLDALGKWYKIQRMPGDDDGPFTSWYITSRTAPFTPLGNVSFKGGRLHTVLKYWGPENQQEGVGIASGIYGAVQQFVREGKRSCVIDANSAQSPNSEAKTAFLICGSKSLEISIIKWEGNEAATVTEYFRLPQ